MSDSNQTEQIQIKKKFESESVQWEEMYHLDDYVSKGFQWRMKDGIHLCQEFVKESGSILDVGCGTGHASFKLAQLGYRVLGVDIARQMIEQADRNSKLLPESGCEFKCIDFLNSKQELGRFDGIIALGFIEYFDDPVKLLTSMGDCLNENGCIIIQIWNKTPLADGSFKYVNKCYFMVRHPVRHLKHLVKRILPKKLVERYQSQRPNTAEKPYVSVNHLRYSPEEFESLVDKAGFKVLGVNGSRYFPTQFFIGDKLKCRIDMHLQRLAKNNLWLKNRAINLTFAIQKK